jgi:hypothetical protein
MEYGMIMHHLNDDIRPRRNIVKIKVKKPWELPTGHREDRYTVMDNRPKRQRTRKDIERQWRNEYEN